MWPAWRRSIRARCRARSTSRPAPSSTRRPRRGCCGPRDELGYRPNSIARGLKTNRSFTVGVLIPDITNPLFPPIVRGIEDRLDEAGYTSLIVNTDNDAERERAISRRCAPARSTV